MQRPSKPILTTHTGLALAVLCTLCLALPITHAQTASPKPARLSTVLALTGAGSYRDGRDMKVVEALLISTEFVNPAIEEATGLNAEQWPGLIQVELTPVGPRASQLTVTALPGKGVDDPDKIARAVLQSLTSRITETYNGMTETDNQGNDEEYENLAREHDELGQTLADLQEKLRQMTQGPTTPREMLEQREQLERHRQFQSLTTLHETQKTRLAATQTTVEQIQAEAADAPVDEKLLELIRARQKHVEALESQDPTDPVAIAAARAGLAEARYEQDNPRTNTVRAKLAEWRAKLVDMRIELAQTEAQLAALRVQLEDQPPSALADAGDNAAIRAELNRQSREVERRQQAVQQRLFELERLKQMGNSQPKLVVLSETSQTGDPSDAPKKTR